MASLLFDSVRLTKDSGRPALAARIGDTLHGTATHTVDGDTLKFYHQPRPPLLPGPLARPLDPVPADRAAVKAKNFSIRLAGIDAPETAHFGRPAQPFSAEARDRLHALVHGRPVRLSVLDVDQYDRVVAIVSVKADGADADADAACLGTCFGIAAWTDVAEVLLREGLADMYTGGGASYGGKEDQYRHLLEKAIAANVGMWSDPNVERPSEYKKRHR